MKILECATLTARGTEFVIIRAPDDALGDILQLGSIMAQAERDWPDRYPMVLGRDTGKMFGHPEHHRLVRGFEAETADWVQWNMEEWPPSEWPEH